MHCTNKTYIIDELFSGSTLSENLSQVVLYAENIGNGVPIYDHKSGRTLYFNTINAGANIHITTGTTGITISSTGGGGSGSTVYDGASPTNVTVGGLPSGTDIFGMELSDIIEKMVVTYLAPAFSAFAVTGQATTVEVGTTLSGSKTFSWSTTNSGNVQANSIVIRDVTASNNLASGLANDGTETTSIATIQLNSDGASQSWRGQGTNSQSAGFNSANFIVTGRFYRFFGPSATSPTNSAQVRALPNNAFHTAGATFTLNTGNAVTKFIVALPPGRTIAQVIDTDALNANITASYVLTGTINVVDAGGTNRSYNLYEMNLGAPYASSHAHQITTA